MHFSCNCCKNILKNNYKVHLFDSEDLLDKENDKKNKN